MQLKHELELFTYNMTFFFINKNLIFILQEDERYKLRMKHLVEKEKLVLAVEQVKYFII